MKTTLRSLSIFIVIATMFVFILGCGAKIVTTEIDEAGIQYYLGDDSSSYAVTFEHVTDSILVVPEEYKGKPVTTVLVTINSTSDGAIPITNLTLPNSVTAIMDHAFILFYNLETIVLSENLIYLGRGAFEDCYQLSSITIPASLSQILPYTFSYCSRLHSVIFEGTVTSIGEYAFSQCLSLTNISFPEGLTQIDRGAFFMCFSLEEVELPSTLLTLGNHVFESCHALKTVSLPEGINQIGRMVFADCPLLETFLLPANNAYYSYEDGILFNKDKTILISVYQPIIDTTYIVPSSVLKIEDYAFFGYFNLVTVVFPASLEEIGLHSFFWCESLENIEVDLSNTMYSSQDGVLYSKDMTVLVLYPQSKPDTSFVVPSTVNEIASYSFTSLKYLTELTIPDTVQVISDQAVTNCPNLIIHTTDE